MSADSRFTGHIVHLDKPEAKGSDGSGPFPRNEK